MNKNNYSNLKRNKNSNNSRKKISSKSNTNNAQKSSQKIDKNQNNKQLWAIIIFSVGLLMFFITIIEGSNIWKFLHNIVFGFFGITSFIISPILVYISVVATIDNSNSSIINKFWQSAILIILISSVVQIFGTGYIPGENFIDKFISLYNNGVHMKGGGLVTAFVAWPLMSAFGVLGSKIVILLLTFVLIMIISGATLFSFLKFIIKPFKNIENTYIRKNNERKMRLDNKFDINVDIEDKFPNHPVSSPKNRFNIPDIPYYDNNVIEDKSKVIKDIDQKIKKDKIIDNKKELQNNNDSDTQKVLDNLVKKVTNENNEKIESKSEKIDSILKKSNQSTYVDLYKYPSLSFLKHPKFNNNVDVSEELKLNAQLLVDTLKSFGVQTRVIDISRGPSVTRYELQPSAGVKISKITNLSDDIALNLATAGVRIEAPIPNKPAVGIEVPNRNVDIVTLREIIESKDFSNSKSNLTVCLGKDIAGNMAIADLSRMPHTLIAGSTGSGKSVCINSIIVSLLYKASPDEVKLLMIDPKVVELGIYNGIPHLLVPVVTDPRKAAGALNWAVTEMLNRYKMFADNGVRDLNGYNRLAKKSEDINPMPQIVIVIDELADLMMASPNEVEDSICRLAQMARAAGMHLVIATQRPSVDIITGVIKANIPSRIAFAVSSQVDSRTILDGSGAEKLLGRGDMLFSPVGSPKPIRIQGCFVSDDEVEQVVSFIKNKDTAEYDEKIIEEIEKQAVISKTKDSSNSDSGEFDAEDEMFPEAVKCVVDSGQASTSYLQRKLKLGYARAARIIDELEERGIVGPYEGGKRKVIMTKQEWREMNIRNNE